RASLAVPWAVARCAGLAAGRPPGASAAEYTLDSTAVYDVRPDEGEIGVSVGLEFTNTTPDPAGQFSVFDEVKVAVHDGVSEVAASDPDGELDVSVAIEDEVNVATIQLREELRFEESVELELDYVLADGSDAAVRVRPSVVVFPAWSFGTASEVEISIPAGYEVRVDGDPLTSTSDGTLESGPIEDPSQWLALVTATRPGDMTSFNAHVALDGGTAALEVRSFADDEAWGERTLSLIERALPLLEEEIGLPYPRIGDLVVIETVATDSSGFGERSSTGTEILVAFDQPPFTALHQVAHVWLSSTLIEDRWIREGMASEIAARVAAELDVDLPYNPAEEAAARAEDAIRLDAWGTAESGPSETYAHAASWAFIAGMAETVGPDALRTTLERVAASVGPYAAREIDATPPSDGSPPTMPLTSRSLLDHLETVSGANLADAFGEDVLSDADVALLPARRDARDAFGALVATANGWGAPDPVRAAMVAWRFEDAIAQIEEAQAWLEDRDALHAEMRDAGLSAPDRLQQAYRSFGGGAEARSELDAQGAVVEAYVATASDVNAPRSFLERLGLIGGPDPAQQLTLANGRFADGDLRGSVEAITEAQRILASAEAGGWVRAISIGLVVLVLAALAVLLFRRRAAYTGP
ncbi:MAG: hypothetical protein K5924_11795, partial [Chloroflexi bacterium]|nr:hypothetical protein [Chloroflexota bacterium]